MSVQILKRCVAVAVTGAIVVAGCREKPRAGPAPRLTADPRRLLAEASRSAARISDRGVRATVLADIARTQGNAGHVAEARQTMARISSRCTPVHVGLPADWPGSSTAQGGDAP